LKLSNEDVSLVHVNDVGRRPIKSRVMAPQGFFSAEERAREKRESRIRDMQRIACGEVSRADVQKSNGFFSSLDARRARLVSPRIRVQIAA